MGDVDDLSGNLIANLAIGEIIVIAALVVGSSCFGGSGNSQLSGVGGANELHGEKANDTLDGDASRDAIDGASGDVPLFGGEDNDLHFGGSVANSLSSSYDDVLLYKKKQKPPGRGKGETGNDALYVGQGRRVIWP